MRNPIAALAKLGPPGQKRRQELMNSLTHGLAALASIALLGPLIILAAIKGNTRHVISFSIMGAALVILFSASTLLHFKRIAGRAKAVYGFLDHAGIYLLIAGTYTPFCLVTLHASKVGWILFSVIWGLAGIGMTLTLVYGEKFMNFGNAIYLAMGWLIMLAIKPLMAGLTMPGFLLLLGGGLSYSVGVVFLVAKKSYHYHAIWHLFVGLGALLHLAAVVFYVLPDLH